MTERPNEILGVIAIECPHCKNSVLPERSEVLLRDNSGFSLETRPGYIDVDQVQRKLFHCEPCDYYYKKVDVLGNVSKINKDL